MVTIINCNKFIRGQRVSPFLNKAKTNTSNKILFKVNNTRIGKKFKVKSTFLLWKRLAFKVIQFKVSISGKV